MCADLGGVHKQLLDVQFVQQQCPPDSVHGHTDVGLAVGNLEKLLDVLCMIVVKRKE